MVDFEFNKLPMFGTKAPEVTSRSMRESIPGTVPLLTEVNIPSFGHKITF